MTTSTSCARPWVWAAMACSARREVCTMSPMVWESIWAKSGPSAAAGSLAAEGAALPWTEA